jgi:hypothetical protein
VTKFADIGCSITYKKDVAIITSKSGVVVLRAKRSENLYIVQGRSAVGRDEKKKKKSESESDSSSSDSDSDDGRSDQ